MLKITRILLVTSLLIGVSGCSEYYRDQVMAPSEQELEDARRNIAPRKGALRDGVFHMQRIQEGSSVRVREDIQLQKPDLPPFDVAYISRDLESVLLELSNAAGESVVIPAGLRGRTITLVHSGADFREMLELVLGKAGYHYNYVDGVWHITRYPIRNYILEVSQSSRRGSLTSKAELQPEAGEATGSTSSVELDTEYSDTVWAEVRETMQELIKVGESEVKSRSLQAQGVTGTGQIITDAQQLSAGGELSLEEDDPEQVEDELFGAMTAGGGVRPFQISGPSSTDHLEPEEDADPWYRATESAGLITVRASPEAHRQIEAYLEEVQSSAHRQVIVEARVVALIRDKNTDRGADLDINVKDTGGSNSVLSDLGFKANAQVVESALTGGFFTLALNRGDDLNFIVQSLSTIGDVYTISSPNLIARNNQISRVSVTRQLGFVQTEVEQNTTSSGDVVIGSRQDVARFKNSGTVMSVMPFVGKSKVQLRFRLSVASQSGETVIRTAIGDEDPIENAVPELANNVIDQDMVVEFGRVYAIGGLVETSTNITQSYEPTLRQIPGLAEVFQRAQNRQQDTEFLVLIKVSRA